jgi:hypothetical protein
MLIKRLGGNTRAIESSLHQHIGYLTIAALVTATTFLARPPNSSFPLSFFRHPREGGDLLRPRKGGLPSLAGMTELGVPE